MTDIFQRASDSVIVLHQLIEAVFHGDGSRMADLLSHFDAGFEMVTPAGRSLLMPDVAALFTELTGARQGMTITISQCKAIAQLGSEVIVQYRELQEMAGTSNDRISLAVIDCATQPPRWRYLQETRVTG